MSIDSFGEPCLSTENLISDYTLFYIRTSNLGAENACTRVPIHFSENLKNEKMKILVHFHFSFLLKIENDFSIPSFKIHFSLFIL